MASELAELTARVQRLEDLESVRATWLDYCHRLDAVDFEALADVFTEDADLEMDGLGAGLDGAYHGRRSIIDDFYTRTDAPPSTTTSAAATSTTATTSTSKPPGLQTGHLSTNMQIELDGDQATSLAYFFEIVDDNLVLIGTYQHRMRRDPDRWRFAFLRISVRDRCRLEASRPWGRTLGDILAQPV